MKQGIIQQSLSGFYDILTDGEIHRTRARGIFVLGKLNQLLVIELNLRMATFFVFYHEKTN